jgi:pyruvate formate lyase activating enzyme
MEHRARHFERRADGTVECLLCPARCKLRDGQVGICRVRSNRGGDLVTTNYGEAVTLAVDPIEKKPLYHFHPGSDILSTGANCCNLRCRHCQNWQISQEEVPTTYLSPERLADTARHYNTLGVAFTYTEPTVWFEYIMDTAPLLREAGQKVVLVTNGYIEPEPLAELIQVTDAMNIDIKGMDPRFYLKVCGGRLQPILDVVRTVGESDVHLEVTNLIIPGHNDSEAAVRSLVEFVASVSSEIPLHFSAYHPSYKMEAPATPADTLLKAREIAKHSLNYVYLGNLATGEGNDTSCPGCGGRLVERSGYRARVQNLTDGVCRLCGYATGIVQ